MATEWTTACPACVHPIALRRLDGAAPCPGCGRAVELPPGARRELLRHCAGAAGRTPRPRAKVAHGVTCVAGAAPAACPRCRQPVRPGAPAAGAQDAAAPAWWVVCEACQLQVERWPHGADDAGVRATITIDVLAAPAGVVQALSCARCAGALTITPGSATDPAIAVCAFCGQWHRLLQPVAGHAPCPQLWLGFDD